MVRDRLGVFVLATALAAVLALPAAAGASVTVSDLSVAPTTTAAGAHPDVTITETFSYSDSSDSIKKTVLHMPAGLLGNPQATALCSQADFQADSCPDNTQVGEVSVGAKLLGLPPEVPSPGKIYNLVPDGTHPAVLGILVTPTLGNPIRLTSPVSLRTSGDFGIDSPVDNQPKTLDPGAVPLQITSTTLTLYGTRPWMATPFMSNPTSCKPATTTIDATSYEAPDQTVTKSSTFTPTACDQEAFSPKIAATMGASGATARNKHIPFTATITQAAGEAAQLSAAVTLPDSLASAVSPTSTLCTADQLAAAACPANTRIGTATIASPLLPAAVQGPVFAIFRSGQLPGIGVEFGGVLPFVLSGSTGFTGGRLQNSFSGLPDVPLTSFSLAIDGGPNGLLVSKRDLCSGPASIVNAALTGQNGATANLTAPVAVQGCGPARAKRPHASAKLRGLRGRHPLLQLTLRKGVSKLRSVSVTLPRSLVVARPKHGVKVTGASFRLSKRRIKLSRKGKLTLKLPGSGASRVTTKLSGGNFHASKSLKRKLKRHKSVKLKLTIRTVDVTGHRSTLHLKVTATARPKVLPPLADDLSSNSSLD